MTLDADDLRRQDLYRAYDGPIPARMMARPATLDERIANLERLIDIGERKLVEYEASIEKWMERGQPRVAASCRRDAQSIRNTLALYRATLAEIRPVQSLGATG